MVAFLFTGRRPELHILPGSDRTSEVQRVRVGDVVICKNLEKGKTQGPVMRVGVILPWGPVRVLEALLDTGAMCNLIREGILSPHMLQPTPSPMKLVTVTGGPLPGGTHEANSCLLFHASEYGGHSKPDWRAQAILVEAQIHVDIILGYPWMRKMRYLVDLVHNCFRSGKKDQWWLESWQGEEDLNPPQMLTPQLYQELHGDQLDRVSRPSKRV